MASTRNEWINSNRRKNSPIYGAFEEEPRKALNPLLIF